MISIGLLVSHQLYATDSIDEEGGFSGHLNVGAGLTNVESNTISDFSTIDFENESIQSLGSPSSSSTSTTPLVGMELAYTFVSTGTKVFIGNSLEDYISFDFATRAGFRQPIENLGTFGISYLKTSVAAEVWEDPFSINSQRSSTDRDSNGYRLIWDNILDSNLEVTFSKREIEIANEHSGESSNLNDQQRTMLNRNGDVYKATMKYTFSSDSRKHVIAPQLHVVKQDRDGSAVSSDEFGINVNYIFTKDRWSYVFNTSFSKTEFDDVNPIFNEKGDSVRYGLSATLFYQEPFNLENWYLNTGVVALEEQSDIEFYDSSIKQWSLGMLYRF
ncbi:DUF2860 family protein [Vibrio maerlii]|uniref:DUF2860 family protein n=1 Tax=Vibrio maerlii TaxID=2231648 RepID=UPI003B847C4E